MPIAMRTPAPAARIRTLSSSARRLSSMPRAPHLQSQSSGIGPASTVTSNGCGSADAPSTEKRRSRRTIRSASRESAGRLFRISAVVASTIAPRYCAFDCAAFPPMVMAPTMRGSLGPRWDGRSAAYAAAVVTSGSGSPINARAISRSAGVAAARACASGFKIGSD